MKTKIKRFNFAFSTETDALIRKIALETDLKFGAIVKQGVELVAKQKGIK